MHLQDTNWVQYLDEVGQPVKDRVTRLEIKQKEIEKLLQKYNDDYLEMEGIIKTLWKKKEITHAKKVSKLFKRINERRGNEEESAV